MFAPLVQDGEHVLPYTIKVLLGVVLGREVLRGEVMVIAHLGSFALELDTLKGSGRNTMGRWGGYRGWCGCSGDNLLRLSGFCLVFLRGVLVENRDRDYISIIFFYPLQRSMRLIA